MALPNSAPLLDFEALLSREYRPSLVTLRQPNEKFRPDPKKKTVKKTSAITEDNALKQNHKTRRQLEEETSRIVLSLVAQTSAFTRHPISESERPTDDVLKTLFKPPPAKNSSYITDIAPAFHEIELGDWESKINWEGVEENKNNTALDDPMKLLEKPRNHFLDNLIFDETTVAWDGDTTELLEKARKAPLILELGVAGQSVAKHVYQNTILSAQRPTPALKSEAYRNRMERKWSQTIDTAEVTKGLHTDKEKEAAIIEARQKKRAQMAEDKTTRVTEAMGTMAVMGGGRGRTITSSLMGPGGTERTGRPSRSINAGILETEYIEQLDLVNNHTLVRSDWSKIILREYMRPKLPLSVVRGGLSWQFQIRYIPTSKKSEGAGQSSSYQAIMMGTHAGAVSKERLRTEADLSPTEGKLVLLEYAEEKPPIQLTKGMCSKIINYYRGDKSRCPVSAGGGDRPARRKRGAEATSTANDGLKSAAKNDRLPRLEGPNRKTTVLDWVGKLPKKTQKDRAEQEAIDVMPEGVTEMLHPKTHGPFIGGIDEGQTITGLVSNLFVAPMFRHEPELTDFLMILTPPGGAARPGQRDSMGVILRELPSSVFTVGQTEPRTKVHAPNSQGEKSFLNPFVSFQIARALTRAQAREGHGLRFDELQDRILPSYDLPSNSLRQRLKQVAIFDKTTQIWTTKVIGYEDYIGVDALGRSIAPEGVAAFESALATRRRLRDLGIEQLTEKGSHTVVSIGVTMVYLAGQINAARELSRKVKKLGELGKSSKTVPPLQLQFYEKAAEELETAYKSLRQKHEVAQFVYDELQLASWHITKEFIDVHKKGEGTGMMKLTGLGDPSGQGEGFSFLREADSKPSKSVGTGALNAEIKKITGTEDDLRKLTMKQMGALLRSYGMAQKHIDTLKRWDRVHVIRDLSTKAASDGIGDGLERFARGEKMKLSEQKRMYTERIRVIWKRQIAALSAPGDRAMESSGADGDDEANEATAGVDKKSQVGKDDSDSDSDDDDDFAAALEDEMVDRSEANQLVAAHARTGENEGGLGSLRAATQDQDLTKDARELAALKRQREEERAAQEGLKSMKADKVPTFSGDRKVIRKKIVKTYPDGRHTTTFKFILHPEEVGITMARLAQDPNSGRPRAVEPKYEHDPDEKPPGHAMFEDDDDFEYSSKGRLHTGRRRGANRRRGTGGRGTPRPRIGKLKTKTSTEERMKKRKKQEEELEVYSTAAKRKGTSNRRERGSIRDRRPHIMFAERLESFRQEVEARPSAGPFLKPVSKKYIPRYYEVISHPIDLATIRSKISDFQYRTADAFVQDFELMKKNAIKFNTQQNPIAVEACAIYDFIKSQVEASRKELSSLEAAIDDMMNGKPKNKRQKTGAKTKKTKKSGGSKKNTSKAESSIDFGNLSGSSDSDESFGQLLEGLNA